MFATIRQPSGYHFWPATAATSPRTWLHRSTFVNLVAARLSLFYSPMATLRCCRCTVRRPAKSSVVLPLLATMLHATFTLGVHLETARLDISLARRQNATPPAEQLQARTDQNPEQPYWISTASLPGYTGWARPSHTLAGGFKLTGIHMRARRTLCLQFSCILPQCSDGGAVLYSRAYGPSLRAAEQVLDHRNGSYSILVHITQPGQWHVEVVLEYSSSPDASCVLPVCADSTPPYEGYPLPGSPFEVQIGPSQLAVPIAKRLCTNFTNLKGGWTVVNNVARCVNNRSDSFTSAQSRPGE